MAAITSIGQIALTVTDLARAVIFYRDTVGIIFLFEASNLALFDCGGARLMLTIPETPESACGSISCCKTVDIQATSNELTAKGVKFEFPARMIAKMPDHDLWMAFLRDTEGNLAALMSEVREA